MATTLSERTFQRFCEASRIVFSRIAEEATKTPDYMLRLGKQDVVAEVKEITRNKEERESDRLLKERGFGLVTGGTPGARVRQKIADSSAQIKARTKGSLPSLLVLFDSGRVAGHLDPYHVRVAMYGLEQVHFDLPPLGSGVPPHATGMSYGPKRKMTETDNTSISAIGVLFMTGPETIHLHIYHNVFASVPLDAALVARHGIPQWTLDAETPGQTATWLEIKFGNADEKATIKGMGRADMYTIEDVQRMAEWMLLSEKLPYRLAEVRAAIDDPNYFLADFWSSDGSTKMRQVGGSLKASQREIEAALRQGLRPE